MPRTHEAKAERACPQPQALSPDDARALQAPAKHQKYVAAVLGVPNNRVVSKAKRLGGGFGGKETRSIFLHCVAAVSAYHLRRAVRITLDRDEDMQMSGEPTDGWFL